MGDGRVMGGVTHRAGTPGASRGARPVRVTQQGSDRWTEQGVGPSARRHFFLASETPMGGSGELTPGWGDRGSCRAEAWGRTAAPPPPRPARDPLCSPRAAWCCRTARAPWLPPAAGSAFRPYELYVYLGARGTGGLQAAAGGEGRHGSHGPRPCSGHLGKSRPLFLTLPTLQTAPQTDPCAEGCEETRKRRGLAPRWARVGRRPGSGRPAGGDCGLGPGSGLGASAGQRVRRVH